MNEESHMHESTIDRTELVERKAILALGGAVRLPAGFLLPFKISRSTAGPGAGFSSVSIGFDRFRVKKSISYDSGEFDLVQSEDGKLSLYRGGKLFIADISLLPIVRHCPGQAFFNLDSRCEYRCAFCSSPRLPEKDLKNMTAEKILELLEESLSLQHFGTVSFTSGVIVSIDETIERMVDVVSSVHRKYPDLRIGVEPYVSTEEHVVALKEAGASEIKLNVQCAADELFERICPDLDRDNILEMLKISVKIFGKGNVTSNIIYGFGETDDDVTNAIEELCKIGVIPGLRALRINDYNRQPLIDAVGPLEKSDPDRMVRLAEIQKDLMSRYGLDTRTSKTMCLECGCCDIVPFRDIRSSLFLDDSIYRINYLADRGPPRHLYRVPTYDVSLFDTTALHYSRDAWICILARTHID